MSRRVLELDFGTGEKLIISGPLGEAQLDEVAECVANLADPVARKRSVKSFVAGMVESQDDVRRMARGILELSESAGTGTTNVA
jgi:hypothetical protein